MILSAKTIVTGDGKTVLKDSAVRVSDGKIEAVGPLEKLTAAYPSDELHEYGDATILPGLMDLHYHMASSYVGRADRQDFDDYMIGYLALRDAQAAVKRGVTTVRDVGSPFNVCKQLKNAEKKGLVSGLPRIIYCNRAICATGGHGWVGDICQQADGEEEIRKAIRLQLREGATWIKIMTSHRSDISEYTQAELNAAADEAHRRNVKVAVHSTRRPSLQMVIDAGLDTIEHGCELTIEQAKQMVEKGIAWVPTLYVHRNTLNNLEAKIAATGTESFTEYDWETYGVYKPANELFEANFKAFAEAGVLIATGTDMTFQGAPDAPVAQEIALMVRYGMDPVWAIGTGTLNCAKVLRLDEELGEIATGKIADILVVAGDASKDISALEAVVAVYQDGCKV